MKARAKKMRIVRNKIIPFGKKFYAINLFGILFAKGPCSAQTINHEKIHTQQIKETAYIFFYLWYGIEWTARAIKHRGLYEGYRNISFEREAYAHETNFKYIPSRKRYSFLNYLKKGSK